MSSDNKFDDTNEGRDVMTNDVNDVNDGNNGHNKWREVTSDWLGFVYRVVDTILLTGVLIYQNYTLTYLIALFYRHNNVWLFLLLVDFVMICLFLCGAIIAIRYYRKYHVMNRRKVFTTEEYPEKRQESRPKSKLFFMEFPKWLGTLPLVWFCWLFYVLVLSAKIFLLHLHNLDNDKKSIVNNLKHNSEYKDNAEPHTVRLCLATMTVVFLLWIEIHRNHYSNRSLECIKELTTAVVFEIFDSIDLLDLIVSKHEAGGTQLANSSHAQWLSVVVLFVSTINLLLPAIGLFRLSQSSFYAHKLGLRCNILHNILRIFCINIPFMALRLAFWSAFETEISIFMLKNALFLFVSLRHIITEVHELRKPKDKRIRRANSLPLNAMSEMITHDLT